MRLILMLVLGLLLAQPAHAQRDTDIVGISAGFDQIVPIGVWTPMRIDLMGGDAPQTCRVTVSALRDNKEVFTVDVSMTTTPNTPQRLEVPMRVPRDLMRGWGYHQWSFRVAVGVRGRGVVARWDSERQSSDGFSGYVTEDSEAHVGAWVLQINDPRESGLPLRAPATGTGAGATVYQPGSGTYVEPAAPEMTADQIANTRWTANSFPSAAPEEIPRDPKLLSVAHTIVMSAGCVDLLEDAQVQALLGWCASGGRLLITGDPTRLDARWGVGGEPAHVRTFESTDEAEAVLEISAWPIGLGWVEHTRYGMGEDGALTWGVVGQWLDALHVPEYENEEDYFYYSYRQNDKDGDVGALESVVAHFGRIRAPSVWWLLAFVIALAVLVGPLDRFVMKRLGLLHRAWASGLVVVLLGCGLGVLAPEVLRSGQPKAGIAEFIDVGADGTVRTERTVGVLSGRRHSANFNSEADTRGRVWQHLLEGPGRGSFLGARATRLRDGARVPPVGLRPMSLVGVRESYAGTNPITIEQRVVDGVPELRVEAPAGHVVKSVTIGSQDGLSTGSLAPQAAGPGAVFRFRLRPVRQVATVGAQDTAKKLNEWRDGALRSYTETGRFGVVTVEMEQADAPPPDGAPPGIDSVLRTVRVRVVIELEPEFRTALSPPMPEEVDG